MKALMKPSGRPHPDTLKNALGLSGISSVSGTSQYESIIETILQELKSLTSTATVSLEGRLDQGEASLQTYVFSVPGGNTGNVQFSRTSLDVFTMRATLFWSHLPLSIDQVVTASDRIWEASEWRVLLAYDSDDYSLQNCTMVLGMEYWGLVRDQLEFIDRFGIVEEIDTRANPGFMLNQDGLFWSVQWLNYWSANAQKKMFSTRPTGFPAGVQVKDLLQGAIRVRLSQKPGSFDDVEFHKRQFECRRRLPFAAPFRLPED